LSRTRHDPSPHHRHIYVTSALPTRASRTLARSPCPAALPMRFVFLDLQVSLHASSPRSVILLQLPFTSLDVVHSRERLASPNRARAGHTSKGPVLFLEDWPCSSDSLPEGREIRSSMTSVSRSRSQPARHRAASWKPVRGRG